MNILITGAASGLGKALAHVLRLDGHIVTAYDKSAGQDVCAPDRSAIPTNLDVLVNCAGVNGIDWLENVEEETYDKIMDTNAKGIFLMSQTCVPILRSRGGTILNIVSNAAHMPMRCSAAYNASKAAAWMLTKQMARELSPDVTVFSVSPNKLSGTGMSHFIDQEVIRTRGWSLEKAQEYQNAGLLTGEETPPDAVARFIAYLLLSKNNHKYLTGCDIPYGA